MEKKRILPLLAMVFVMAGCSTTQKHPAAKASTLHKVRTTAYTQTEPGGAKNAVGCRLACGSLNSAAADWSQFPLGTKFKLLCTGEIFQVDDYGSALVGTNTIDLYKTTRSAMRNWGVRMVDIEILEWGSFEKSLEVLKPRARNSHVQKMISRLAGNSSLSAR